MLPLPSFLLVDSPSRGPNTCVAIVTTALAPAAPVKRRRNELALRAELMNRMLERLFARRHCQILNITATATATATATGLPTQFFLCLQYRMFP
jgi:hypothetical protein